MRQGEVAPRNQWTGDPQGGVKAPQPILLPDPSSRFARTAERLGALAGPHPMRDWLLFMAQVAAAQHAAAMAVMGVASLDPADVERAVTARMPPLAADGHRRSAAWREALARFLQGLETQPLSAPVAAMVVEVRRHDAAALEALADKVLRGVVRGADAGIALAVVAALQVYFTVSAAHLQVDTLRLLEQRGLCPCCGSTPVAGLVTATGPTPGTRYLHCSLCGTAWNHVRAVCITCGEAREVSLKGIEGDSGVVKAETCGDCRTYAKMFYQAKDTRVDPHADDLTTLGLDLLLAENGWPRHAPNPFLMVGDADAPEATV